MSEPKPPTKFTERLSMVTMTVAALGAFLVLIDPRLTLTIAGQTVQIGGDGFSADLKGAVVSLILIGGWTAVTTYWLGSSEGSTAKGESLARIAESPAVVAVPASPAAPIQADVVQVDANTANVTEKGAIP